MDHPVIGRGLASGLLRLAIPAHRETVNGIHGSNVHAASAILLSRDVVQLVECLPGMLEATPSTA